MKQEKYKRYLHLILSQKATRRALTSMMQAVPIVAPYNTLTPVLTLSSPELTNSNWLLQEESIARAEVLKLCTVVLREETPD